jgi:L-aspartate oxidase
MSDFHALADRPVIIGGGLAGLAAALEAAPRKVVLITAGTLSDGAASLWSQGGIAAAIGEDDDVALHSADTIAAGDGLCDPVAVARIIGAGPSVIERLMALGVGFDRDGSGAIALGLEAAHARRRIVHVRDHTGAAVTAAATASVRAAAHVTLIEHAAALQIATREGRVIGVWIATPDGVRFLRSGAVLVATGGAAGLYRASSAPSGATGSGLALAAEAGAALRDLEFMQFHPTGLDAGVSPLPLISEAVRGEGAALVDETGVRFIDELLPRDVVARAIYAHQTRGHRCFLDARGMGARFHTRFPSIAASCARAGIDPAQTPMPIRPVAHYHMGGIAVDAAGQSTVPGLFAAGEAASTGLHGANRLASNSLLEAFVTGADVGFLLRTLDATGADHRIGVVSGLAADLAQLDMIRQIMDRDLFVQRNRAGMRRAIAALSPLAARNPAALVALMMAVAAHDRQESRGGHATSDYPARSGAEPVSSNLTLASALQRTHAILRQRIAA